MKLRENKWIKPLYEWQYTPAVVITAYIGMVLGIFGYLSWYVLEYFQGFLAMVSFTLIVVIGGVLILLGGIKLSLKFEELGW